jgi:hypothetical protein
MVPYFGKLVHIIILKNEFHQFFITIKVLNKYEWVANIDKWIVKCISLL